VNGNLSCNGQIITETFSKYFVLVAQYNHNANATPNRENPICYLSRAFNQPFPTINLKCISSKEIEDITKSLKIKNSHGYDGISTTILRFSIPYISSPLTYICNRMLTTGNFPTRLKFSEIRPIFKRGYKNDTSNYRPISLLTPFSKIFEKVIYNRLLVYHHIKDNYIFANEQFGFRHASSTDSASYHLINNILTALRLPVTRLVYESLVLASELAMCFGIYTGLLRSCNQMPVSRLVHT
jgi:Notch-like protein